MSVRALCQDTQRLPERRKPRDGEAVGTIQPVSAADSVNADAGRKWSRPTLSLGNDVYLREPFL